MGQGCGGCFNGLILFKGNFTQSYLGERSYWNAAYKAGRYQDTYEWLQTCEELYPFVPRELENRPACNVLHVGCGNSLFGKLVADAGHNVVNVDYSEVVIDAMRKQYPELQWVQADCAVDGALGPENTYDLVLDKGGIDALIESQTDHMKEQARRMVKEIHRVLRPGGKYLIFSNSTYHRKELLDTCFQQLDSEYVEGYSMDLYRKLVFVFIATK